MLVQTRDPPKYKPGDVLDVSKMFHEGDLVDIAGTSIGKGFQGMLLPKALTFCGNNICLGLNPVHATAQLGAAVWQTCMPSPFAPK